MNIDLSIHRLAFREAETLGMAQVLVARKRQELDLKLARQTVARSAETANSLVDHALEDMLQRSEGLERTAPPPNDSGVLVDKTA